jgi:hypothetical protein
MSKSANNAIETVRLSEEGKHKLIEGINDQTANVDVPFERRNIRVDYVNPKLPVLTSNPAAKRLHMWQWHGI